MQLDRVIGLAYGVRCLKWLLLSWMITQTSSVSVWAQPQEKPAIVVLELKNSAGISPREAQYLHGLILYQVAECRCVVVIDQSSLPELLPEARLEDCVGTSEIETGRMFNARYVVQGEVIRFGQSLRLTLELSDTTQGALIAMKTARGEDVEELSRAVPDTVKAFMEHVKQLAAPSQSIASGLSDQERPQGSTRSQRSFARIDQRDEPRASTREMAKTALVIGNGAYASSPLKNPERDASAMAVLIKSLGFELIGGEAQLNQDQRQMRRLMIDFGRQLKEKGGVSLFYYAGHGIQSQGSNYLIPIHAVLDSEEYLEVETLSLSRVMSALQAGETQTNIIILDACRDNPFARSWRSAVKGLAMADAPSGTFLAYATAPGSVAMDGRGEHGTYTQSLLHHLPTPGLSIEELFKRVRVDVKSETRGAQVPWESTSLETPFMFKEPLSCDRRCQPMCEQNCLTQLQKKRAPPEKHRIAFIPFTDQSSPERKATHQSRFYSQLAQQGLIEHYGDRLQFLTLDNLLTMLPDELIDQLSSCNIECRRQVQNGTGSDFLILGEYSKTGEDRFLSVSLFDRTGYLISIENLALSPRERLDQEALSSLMKKLMRKQFERGQP